MPGQLMTGGDTGRARSSEERSVRDRSRGLRWAWGRRETAGSEAKWGLKKGDFRYLEFPLDGRYHLQSNAFKLWGMDENHVGYLFKMQVRPEILFQRPHMILTLAVWGAQ